MGNEVPRHESADRPDFEVLGLNRRSLAYATVLGLLSGRRWRV